MTAEERKNWWQVFHKFQQSREKTWAPKINKELRAQFKAIADYLQANGIQATISNIVAIVPMEGIAKLITNIYKDAATVFGGKAYQMVKKQVKRQQKALTPIGFNEELVNEIIQYFQLNLLDKAVLPITQTTRDKALKILIDAQNNGVSIDDIVKKLESTDLTTNRSRLIARTETVKAANFGAVQSVKKLGYRTLKIWISGKDMRTRRIPRDDADHLHADGMKVPIDEPFKIKDKKTGGFVNMMQPGDPNGGAENCVNCRCTVGFEVLD